MSLEISGERIALLGASRGFGAQVALQILREMPLTSTLIVARKPFQSAGHAFEFFECDFSRSELRDQLVDKLRTFNPHRIFYFAGGGPHGAYGAKDWKDHEWAWKVSFETPAFIIWSALQGNLGRGLQQMIVTGSAIAEESPDPFSASYAAAKHALKGLIDSVRAERPQEFDLRIFSPGYMDTQLLPINAWPRKQPGLVQDPARVAKEFLHLAFRSEESVLTANEASI